MIPGNCLLCAAWEWAKHPASTSIRFARNRSRRWHAYWVRGGKRFEFYAPGRSSKSYLQNLVYFGRCREFTVKQCNATTITTKLENT